MRSRLALLLLVLVGAGVALGVALLLGGEPDAADVLSDDGASADDVVAASAAPREVVRTADGATAALHELRDTEGGDATKSAVRVTGADGEVVVTRAVPSSAELAAAGRDVLVVTGRAVRRLGADGDLEVLPVEPADGVEPGDVLLRELGTPVLARPSDGSVHGVPLPADVDDVQQLALDAGRLWVLPGWDEDVTVLSTTDGRRWTSARYPLGDAIAPLELAARGDTAVLTDVGDDDGTLRTTRLQLVRDGRVRALDVPDGLGEALAHHTPSGRLLLGDSASGWWRRDGGTWTRLRPPGTVWRTVVLGPDLAALGPDGAWTSADEGDSWRPFAG